MSAGQHGGGVAGRTAADDFDVDDPTLSRFDLVREGARRDGVEIVHYAPRFPKRGTKAEKRVERSIALLLTLSGLLAFGMVAAYIWWPFQYEPGVTASKFYTPLLALGLGGSLFLIGLAVITWAKKLLPEETSIQDRHDGASPHDEQQLTGAAILNLVDETGIKRRPLLKLAILLPAGGLGVAAAAPLVGSLLKNPNDGHILLTTGWDPAHNGDKKVRLTRDDGTPIRPEDVSVGGQMTVFPGIPHGATNQYADSPTLLIHLREDDAQKLRDSIASSKARDEAGEDVPQPVVAGMWENFVAYSKICTHAAARRASTSSRPTGCSAPATSHSSSSPSRHGRSSARPTGSFRCFRWSWRTVSSWRSRTSWSRSDRRTGSGHHE